MPDDTTTPPPATRGAPARVETRPPEPQRPPLSSAQIAARRAERAKADAEDEAEEEAARRREAAERQHTAKLKSDGDALAVTLNKGRTALWTAPWPKTFAETSNVAVELIAVISEYRAAAEALGMPRWEIDATVGAHPIMRLAEWLSHFLPAPTPRG